MLLTEREIADYLLANPLFFERHAELLANVKLLSPHGNRAVSLQERQMDMLRDKNKQIERRLAELLRYGHENDGIAARFTRWTARVLAERDPHALPATVTRGLLEVFDVPLAALRLWDVAQTYAMADFSRYVGEEVRIFRQQSRGAVLRGEFRLRSSAVARGRRREPGDRAARRARWGRRGQ